MVVLDSFSGAESLTYTIEQYWGGGGPYNSAQTVNATCAYAATLASLMVRMMKYGLPNAIMRIDVYDVNMNLVDWTETFNASTLSAKAFQSKQLNLTQGYICTLGQVLYSGCRCVSAVLIDYDNCVYFAVTPASGRTIKYYVETAGWLTSTDRSLGFTLTGTEITVSKVHGDGLTLWS
jgi:hypothetical protein